MDEVGGAPPDSPPPDKSPAEPLADERRLSAHLGRMAGAGFVPQSQDEIDTLKPTEPWPGASATERHVYQTAYVAAKALWENDQLKTENEKLRSEVLYDALTGLHSKEALRWEIDRRMGFNKPFGVLWSDFDAFKQVNDTYGHEEGDRLLRDWGAYVRQAFSRQNDFLAHEQIPVKENAHLTARYGGDEFVHVVGLTPDELDEENRPINPDNEMEHEVKYFKDVFAAFVAAQPDTIKQLNFDASFGYVVWKPGMERNTSHLLQKADAAMYADKKEHQLHRKIEGQRQSFS